jgi:ribosomal protein S18 acetylase RimI-like enzyme
MEGLTVREYADEDAPALADLFSAIERHAGGDLCWTAAEIRAVLAATVRDRARDLRLLFDTGGPARPPAEPPTAAGPTAAGSTATGLTAAGSTATGSTATGPNLVAAAVVSTPPDGGFRVDLTGAVLPGLRGRGIGRDLMAWQLRRAEEIHRDTAPGSPWEVHVAVSAADADALRLYRRFGLDPVRYWFDMVAPTGTAPVIAAPDGLTITGYRAGLDLDLHAAHVEAFADHWGNQARDYAGWRALAVDNETFAPELSRIALDGGEIAGYVLAYDDADPSRVYLGQVGVRRPWRRRGLAAAMLARVLGASAEAGRSGASLSVDADSPTGAVGVYERVGFAVQSRGVTYASHLPARSPAGHRPS